jgi:hypothetical protein
MSDLVMTLRYDMKDGSFTWDEARTNVKPEVRGELITDFLHSQIGSGKDPNPAVEREVYEIRISVDLSCDRFSVQHDCGNMGLCDGILMDVLRRLD